MYDLVLKKGWLTKGAAAHILDNLYADRAADVTPMIVVMPYGYALKQGAKPPPTTEREARAKISRDFEQEVTAELVPFIDSKYPTIADRHHRAARRARSLEDDRRRERTAVPREG